MQLSELYSIISVVGGVVLYQIVFVIIRAWARRKRRMLPALLNENIYYPGMFLSLFVAVSGGLLFIKDHFKTAALDSLQHVLNILIILTVGFLLIRLLNVFKGLTIHHYQNENPNDYTLRKVRTKFLLIQRVVNFVLGTLTIAAALMTFEAVRQVGTTILASAGVVGLIVGFAAQKSIGSLFAGIQIAISQPIRIDDVVVVDNHFGAITEITLTYVILDTWDGRRLTIPINYFLENTFENWTRVSSDVIAKIRIRVDYSIPVEEMRTVFLGWVRESLLWDKRKAGFLVTDAGERTIELRGTASTRNSDDAFDLECLLREKLITYIRKTYPESLPQSRVAVTEHLNNTHEKETFV
jgi:small-conductance mechanosensitive channel